MENKILEAYNAGKRVKHKMWAKNTWVKKLDEQNSIDEDGDTLDNDFSFDTSPEIWEIHPEDVEPETPQNHIVEAFEAGKKIKHIKWANDEWIMKIGDNRTMSQYSESKPQEALNKYPELWEIVEEPETPQNPIVEAYNAGEKIRNKKWYKHEWIKKINEIEGASENGKIFNAIKWSFYTSPDFWEIYTEDIEPEAPELQTEIQKAIKLLIENNYEVYFITKTKIVL